MLCFAVDTYFKHIIITFMSYLKVKQHEKYKVWSKEVNSLKFFSTSSAQVCNSTLSDNATVCSGTPPNCTLIALSFIKGQPTRSLQGKLHQAECQIVYGQGAFSQPEHCRLFISSVCSPLPDNIGLIQPQVTQPHVIDTNLLEMDFHSFIQIAKTSSYRISAF